MGTIRVGCTSILQVSPSQLELTSTCSNPWTCSLHDVSPNSPKFTLSRVGSPHLEEGLASLGTVELPLLDDAVPLDGQVRSQAGVGVPTADGGGALQQVYVVAVLYDGVWV